MSAIMRSTENYAWYEKDLLGEGGTSSVCKGFYIKDTTKPVAIKIVKYKDLVEREFNVLNGINHPNIIKLFAKEIETGTIDKAVLIMEYANGGNLYNILKEPQNSNGLSQTEFLLLLKDLSAAIKYMNDEQLIHKDLKPQNIVKFISIDGQITFKLIDLGTARKLEENETFASIGGTEEYAHPDIYYRAFINNQGNAHFKVHVDLWSLGVTLYQAANNLFPFSVGRYRCNRDTMYKILSQKPSGCISGQFSEKENIVWSKTLPENSQLSDGLKELLTPLIAGLFELEDEKRWSFNDYIKAVDKILKKHIIHVFNVNDCKSIELFIDKNDDKQKMIEELRESIFRQTKVTVTKQILLLDNKDMKNWTFSTNDEIDKLLTTTKEKPIFLYNNDNNNNVQLSTKQLEEPTFKVFNQEADDIIIKIFYMISYEYKRRIDNLIMIEFLLKQSVQQFNINLATTISPLSREIVYLKKSFNFTSKSLNIFEQTSENEEKCKSFKKKLNEIEKYLHLSDDVIKKMHENHVEKKILINEWNSVIFGKELQNNSSEMAQNFMKCLKESYINLRRYMKKANLIVYEQQQKTFEIIKFRKHFEELKVLLIENIVPTVKRVSEYLSDWYKSAQANYIKVQILENNLNDYKRMLKEISKEINNDEKVKKIKDEKFKKFSQMFTKEKDCILNQQEKLIHKIFKEIKESKSTEVENNSIKYEELNEPTEVENANNSTKNEELNEPTEAENSIKGEENEPISSNTKSLDLKINFLSTV